MEEAKAKLEAIEAKIKTLELQYEKLDRLVYKLFKRLKNDIVHEQAVQ